MTTGLLASWRARACAGTIAALASSLGAPLTASAEAAEGWLPLPSGMQARLGEIIWDEDDALGRFRFIAPALADHADDGERIDADMLALCRDFARPVQRGLRPEWDSVVISLAEAPIAFGDYDAAVLQLFAGFSIEGGDCQWDGF